MTEKAAKDFLSDLLQYRGLNYSYSEKNILRNDVKKFFKLEGDEFLKAYNEKTSILSVYYFLHDYKSEKEIAKTKTAAIKALKENGWNDERIKFEFKGLF